MLVPTFGICELEQRGCVDEIDPRPFSEQLKSAWEDLQEAERAAAGGDLETESGGKSCLQVLASFLPSRKPAK